MQLLYRSTCVVLALSVATAASAQDDPCGGLLAHGMYDFFVETRSASSYAQAKRGICEQYNSHKQKKAGGSASASYGLFDGSLSMSAEELETVGRAMCEGSESQSANDSMLSTSKRVINSAAVNAYTACRALANQNLIARTTYVEDDLGVKEIILNVHYQGAVGDSMVPSRQVNSIEYDTTHFTCTTGDLKTAFDGAKGKPLILSNQVRTLRCVRTIPKTPLEEAERRLWAKAGSITIGTSAGGIVRTVGAIFAENPDFRLNVGEIVASLLTEAQFKDSYGEGWVLADGREVAASAYARLTGRKSVPNLQNRLLRGIRTDDALAVAAGSDDVTLSVEHLPAHTHATPLRLAGEDFPGQATFDINSEAGKSHYAPNTRNGNTGNNWSWRGSRTGPEGQGKALTFNPSNVGVNFFIKVN
jgi:hypothetical protein